MRLRNAKIGNGHAPPARERRVGGLPWGVRDAAAGEKKRGRVRFPYLHVLAELSQSNTSTRHLTLLRAGLAHRFTQLAEAADRIVAITPSDPGSALQAWPPAISP